MNNIKRFMVLGTLFTMCFLFVSNTYTYEVDAKAYSCESYVSADGIILADYDVPTEVKEPVEKGKSLVKYLMYSFCGIVALVGIIMAVVGALRHNPDVSANGWKVVGIALVGFLAVAVINWLIPDAKL